MSPPPTLKTSRCNHCQKLGIELPISHNRCNKCKTTFYCTRSCKKLDWPRHKKACGKPASSVDTTSQRNTAGTGHALVFDENYQTHVPQTSSDTNTPRHPARLVFATVSSDEEAHREDSQPPAADSTNNDILSIRKLGSLLYLKLRAMRL